MIELPRSTFEVDGQVEGGLLTVGNQIPMMTNDGMRLIGVVASVDGDKVKIVSITPWPARRSTLQAR